MSLFLGLSVCLSQLTLLRHHGTVDCTELGVQGLKPFTVKQLQDKVKKDEMGGLEEMQKFNKGRPVKVTKVTTIESK